MVDGTASAVSQRLKWATLFASFLAFVAYAFGFQVVPPLMTAIVQEFSVSNAEAGLLMSFVLLPGIILSIPVSIAMERYGARVTGGVALVCVVISSFMTATSSSFTALLIARLILGIGGSLILIVTPAIVPQWFSREELGRAMGIFTISMPIATIMFVIIPSEASRVRRPTIKAMPPPNSATAANVWRIAGTVASGPIQPIGF